MTGTIILDKTRRFYIMDKVSRKLLNKEDTGWTMKAKQAKKWTDPHEAQEYLRVAQEEQNRLKGCVVATLM